MALGVAPVVAFLIRRAAPRLTALACAGMVSLMALQFGAAASGVLHRWERTPPPFMLLMLVSFGCTIWAGAGPVGRAMTSIPFAWLIGFQLFRFPLELLMHEAAAEGIMPVVMSFSGYNFDILTGLTAPAVAWLASRGRAPRWLLLGWNAMGSLLLAVIVSIAVAATPRFAAFGPGQLNTWVADPPFVWLPGVMVQAALLGHIVVWRKLWADGG